jgi:hypothetical protein
MGFNPIGSEWWTTHYGFTTFAEFKAKCGPLLDPLYGTPLLTQVDDAMLLLAWDSPTSAQGIYLSTVLTAQDFHEGSTGSATVTAQAGAPLIANKIQEGLAMAQLVVAGCFQVTIQAVAGGHTVENVVGVGNGSGNAAGAAAAVKAAWEVSNGPLSKLSSLVTMVNYHAVDLSSTSGTIADLASSAAGSSTGASFATRAASALIKWNGSSRSRSTRGRLYYGPIAEVNVQSDGATLTTTAVSDFNTAFTNFRNSLNSAGYPLVVLSRKNQAFTLVTSHAVEQTTATQRRRLRG